MSGWTVELDPAAVALGRTPLSLNGGNVRVEGNGKGVDWGEAQIKAFLAEQQYGEAPTDFRIPNRIITIPLLLGSGSYLTKAEAVQQQEKGRRELQQKVALFQRQGGVLFRQTATGKPLYADIVNASLIVPDVWGEGGVEPNVMLKLECLPDFYGEEITLDAASGAGEVNAVLQKGGQQATIEGDYPGRARIVVTDPGGHSQRGLFFGLRSTYYSSGAEAALAFDSLSLTMINGASSAAEGAERYATNIVKLASPQAETWHPFIELKPSSGAHLTHLGSYRLYARVQMIPGQRLRLSWANDDATSSTNNQAVEVPEAGQWYIVDLGEVRIEEPPLGEHWWNGSIQVETGATPHAVLVDRIWLQPLDDGGGKLRATAIPASTLLKSDWSPPGTAESSNAIHAGTAWTNAPALTGSEAGPYAEAVLTGSVGATVDSQALVFKNWGITLPAAAVIKGIEVRPIPQRLDAGSLSFGLLKAGAAVGATKEHKVPGTHAVVFGVGGAADLWGSAWTKADIENAGFGFYCWFTSSADAKTRHMRILTPVSIRIWYSYSAGAITQDAVLYASRKVELRWDGAYREDTGTEAYVRVSEETGDLARIPPSGLENRPVQLLVKNSRGLLPGTTGEAPEADTNIDNISAQIIYRPCYIGRI